MIDKLSVVCPTCSAPVGQACVFPCPGHECCDEFSWHERLDDNGDPTGEVHVKRVETIEQRTAEQIAAWLCSLQTNNGSRGVRWLADQRVRWLANQILSGAWRSK